MWTDEESNLLRILMLDEKGWLNRLRHWALSVVGHRCGDALISADERSDVGARVPPTRTATLVLVEIGARQRLPR